MLVSAVNNFCSLPIRNERSLGRVFFLLLDFGQGPIREYFIHKLAPNLQTLTTFYSFIQIQRNQRPLVRYDPLYPVINLKMFLKVLILNANSFVFELRLIIT